MNHGCGFGVVEQVIETSSKGNAEKVSVEGGISITSDSSFCCSGFVVETV